MADDEGTMQVNDGANGDKVVRVNYPANSNRSKTPDKPAKSADAPKKVERITSGEVVQRKKGLGRKIADTFTGENMHSVGEYILHEIVVPQIKTIISDVVSQGTDRTLFGDSRRGSSGNRTYSGTGTRTNYNSMSNRYSGSSVVGRAAEPDGRSMSSRGRANHDFSEIILDNRGEAEEVMDAMHTLISQYETASVADLYDLCGITPVFTDNKWGWSDLRNSGIRRVRDGFLLELPKPEPID